MGKPLCANPKCKRPLAPHYERREVRIEDESGFTTKWVKTGRILGYGYRNEGVFCSLGCGYRFAMSLMKPKE